MVMFKSAKNAHNSSYNIWRYLTQKHGKVEQQIYNINPTDKDRWYSPMDKLRKACGNDEPYHGKKAITYRHCVISPDPKDKATNEQLFELAEKWVKENFPDYQVATVIHRNTDVPHIHVVVNNTNTVDGKRLSISDKQNEEILPNSLNRIALEMGLSPLPDLKMEEPTLTKQKVYKTQAERGGGYKGLSWKDEIRAQIYEISQKATGPLTFDEFRTKMQEAGYDVWKTKRGGYTYQHKNEIPNSKTHDHWKSKDSKLGFAYTPAGLARFYNIGAEQPEAASFFEKANEQQQFIFNEYINIRTELLSDLTLQDRIDTLNFMQQNEVNTQQDFTVAKYLMDSRLQTLAEEASNLEQAIAKQDPLAAAAQAYRANEKIYKRLDKFAGEKTTNKFVYDQYLKAHKNEIKAFTDSQQILSEAGYTTRAQVSRFESLRASQKEQLAAIATERFDIKMNQEHLKSAQHVCERICSADEEARNIAATTKYSYRNQSKKPKGAAYVAHVKHKVSVHEEASKGKQEYRVRYEKEVTVAKAASSSDAANRKWQKQIQEQEVSRKYPKVQPAQQQEQEKKPKQQH